MAAPLSRLALLLAFVLHSILLLGSCIHGLHSQDNLLFVEDMNYHQPMDVNSFITHHRHRRSHHDRQKRQVVTRTLQFSRTVQENFTGVFFELGKEFTDPHRYVLESSTADLFNVNSFSGNVDLQQGKRLDYEGLENVQRSIQLVVNASNQNNATALTQITLTIVVTDVNDEQPEFKNRPYPYLATIAVSTGGDQKVYELYAEDPDSNSDVSYQILSGSDGRFTISTERQFVEYLGASINVGVIKTVGEGRFDENRIFSLRCVAVDNNAFPQQSSMAIVSVKVGVRPPQFFEQTFYGTVRENSLVDQTLNDQFKIEAKSFQDQQITYTLRDAQNRTSTDFYIESDGTVKTLKTFDFESVAREQRPPRFVLNIIATEADSNLESLVTLEVTVLDDNDNAPVFELSTYPTTHQENISIDSEVVTVTALDEDSGTNAELVYSVDNDHFWVETVNRSSQNGGPKYVGIIRVKKGLDYDQTPGHQYSFTVTATDKGTPQRSGTANVRVYMINVNDEEPKIVLDEQKLDVKETMKVGQTVKILQAIDLDGDEVEFYFSPRATTYAIFEIEPLSGLISLRQKVPADVDEYVLNITVFDDGSLGTGIPGPTRLSSTSYLNIEIVDVNTHKPSFPACSYYNTNATILENQAPNTPIIKVKAEDSDRGENGRVTYAILRSKTQPLIYFRVDKESGQITSATGFDRESQPSYSVTVRGNDQGTPSLEGYCTFTVTVEDDNDNPPRFDLPSYTATISESDTPGRSIITVRATDADIGKNADVEYILTESHNGMFRIGRESGTIYLNQTLDGSPSFNLSVMARDKGDVPLDVTVRVTVSVFDQSSKPPTWNSPDYETRNYQVEETAPPGSVITTFAATSNVAEKAMTFYLLDENGNSVESVGPFSIVVSSDRTYVNLTVFLTMDFNVKDKYELRLRVSNHAVNSLSAMIKPVINLIDTNNKVPQFRGRDSNTGFYPGSLPENAGPGQTVIEIKAFDADPTSPNNELIFRIVEKVNVSDKFEIIKIDDTTAVLRSLAEFDREETSLLYLDVMVQDGIASSRPNHVPPGTPNSAVATVQVQITDQNDNSPSFAKSLYNQTVREDVAVEQNILLVTANDPDSAAVLTYAITRGNMRGAFGVRAKTGIIYVGRQLDYETEQHLYRLTLEVNDGKYNSTTIVEIRVTDANDNRPQFVKSMYEVDDIVEEDNTITPTNKRFLTQVNATDADIDRPTNIRYQLILSDEDESRFEIESDTGRVYLLTSLDRDAPYGRDTYQFTVQAEDEPNLPPGGLDQPQVGFTTVRVRPIDINDNAPIFTSRLVGSVMEHSVSGTSVMTVSALDYDADRNALVRYQIVEGPSGPDSEIIFRIDEVTGIIRTNTDESNLDRETTPTYRVKVKATDSGNIPQSSEVNVTITLDDKNDKIPVFQQSEYQVFMSESQTSGPIATVRATDDDIGPNALLDYRLQNHLDFFEMVVVQNEGIINVRRDKVPDYEKEDERQFFLTVICQDPDPTHTAMTTVIVNVTDFNDNAPEFSPSYNRTAVFENAPNGTLLYQFTATDKDSTINAEFTYSIDRKTDPERQFSVDQNGRVVIKTHLDRETQEQHVLHILAIDHGDPSLTGTATLVVDVKDVNDNFPIFAEDYHPVVYENAEIVPEFVLDVRGKDLDNDPFGAPFGFREPDCAGPVADQACCPARPTCDDFSMQFITDGDGYAKVSTKRQFDREKNKFYYMPIVMYDMRGKGDPRAQTGTNTLTIEIGDLNDNKHGPGHQDIFVYNYKNLFGPLEIGRVYATDPDDWDVVDKTYTYKGSQNMAKYFSVDSDTGMITMMKGVPSTLNVNTNVHKPYTFTVDVYDRVYGNTEKCTVSIKVQDITEEAVFRSGSVRLKGMTAEEFMHRPKTPGGDITAYGESKYEQFRNFLAEKMAIPTKNVDVLSVQNKGDSTDVRFAAHGSPYYPAHRMNAIVALNKNVLENDLGIKIDQVPIDECRDERFEGGCYNFLNVTGQPAMVNTNGTSFVGVQMFVEAMEGCRAHFYPPSDECVPNYCYNGGTCHKDEWGELSCQNCPPEYDGPRCQGTKHSFDGSNYALYDSLEQCRESRTSLYFITTERNGILLYNGPVTLRDPESDNPTDFILLELKDGYPRLTIDHGGGPLVLYVDGRDRHGEAKIQETNTGRWHRLDIIRHGRFVTLMLDQCEKAELGQNNAIIDDSMCRKSGVTPDESLNILNVNTPLQLGGRFPAPNYASGNNFNGCIKELMHNGRLYDLTIPGDSYPSGENGCRREEQVCGNRCGENGICEAELRTDTVTCICKPGYFGDKCVNDAPTKDLRTNSFFQWRLKDNFFNVLNARKMKMDIMFRTREPDGALWIVSSPNGNTVLLKIKNGRLTLQYNLGGDVQDLELSYRVANNGHWHRATVTRIGRQFTLQMDNGEGANYNYTMGESTDKEEMHLEINGIFAGAVVTSVQTLPVVTNDLKETCVRDVRMDNKWFPMDTQDSRSEAANLTKQQNVKQGCERNDCENVQCPQDRECFPLWGTYECRCPEHYEDYLDRCEKIRYCDNHKCFQGSTCVENYEFDKNYECLCPEGWTSELCDQIMAKPLVGGITTGAIIAIVVSIFVLLVLIVAIALLITCGRKMSPDDKYILEVDPDDDIRENVINYDEEGAGEEDQDTYDISRLMKPDSESLHKPPLEAMPRREMPRRNAPGESPDVGNFIEDRLGDADEDDDAPPHDAVREFVYEGDGSDAGSLSSLQTSSSTSSQDYDYLNDWGPKFSKLAEMYGAGAEPGEEDV